MPDFLNSSASVLAKFENVTKSYKIKSDPSSPEIGPLSFELRKNEITIFLGPNGAGKSTAFKLLLGLRLPNSGRVTLFGSSPRSSETRKRIGYTSQDLSYPAQLSTKEILHLVSAHFDNPVPIAELCERFDLIKIWSNKLGGLSGGERRRVGLACALAGRPELLILDEPTTGLDVESRAKLWSELREFKKSGGAILMATHDLHEAGLIGDRVLLLHEGKLKLDGSLQEILAPIDFKRLRYEISGQTIELSVRDSDSEIRKLVEARTEFQNLEIKRLGLEEALQIHRGSWESS
jgi:ABC-2 type transport system ATP-binding protein